MVKGLDSFRSYFAGFEDCYVLIGGTACDLNFASAALPFRATRDLDIVLCVEALTPDFSRQFWRFVAEGGYERREKSSGNRRFYRFSHPLNADFPMLLELFSRKPDFIPEDYDGIIAPIPMGEEASSLSAILLDDTYYRFIFAELHRLFKQEGGDRSASTPPMSSSSAGRRRSSA